MSLFKCGCDYQRGVFRPCGFHAQIPGEASDVDDLRAELARVTAERDEAVARCRRSEARELEIHSIIEGKLGPTTIHILSGGHPVCGFDSNKPANWPRGHIWVRAGSPEVNCPNCLLEVES